MIDNIDDGDDAPARTTSWEIAILLGSAITVAAIFVCIGLPSLVWRGFAELSDEARVSVAIGIFCVVAAIIAAVTW